MNKERVQVHDIFLYVGITIFEHYCIVNYCQHSIHIIRMLNSQISYYLTKSWSLNHIEEQMVI